MMYKNDEEEMLKFRVKELEDVRNREVGRINAALGEDLYKSVRPWAENVAISILKLKGDVEGLKLLGINPVRENK